MSDTPSSPEPSDHLENNLSRRSFIYGTGGAVAASSLGLLYADQQWEWGHRGEVFIGKAAQYSMDLKRLILDGFHSVGVSSKEIKGKRILLKPNLVEPHAGSAHINTHPLMVRAVTEAFLRMGAERVLVAEGAGHRRDTQLVLEVSGLAEVLKEDKIRFIDLNYEMARPWKNLGNLSKMDQWFFPRIFDNVDWIVSLAKMKTHHWTGATLTMKNLFGTLPGTYYGWPKNVLHFNGVDKSIFDLAMSLKPQFGIVDGIVGMEGDGPIMGTPKQSGLIVMGRNLAAVDATCARVMELNPWKINYLRMASGYVGPVHENHIKQRGETISDVKTKFEILDEVNQKMNLRV